MRVLRQRQVGARSREYRAAKSCSTRPDYRSLKLMGGYICLGALAAHFDVERPIAVQHDLPNCAHS